MCKQHRWNQRAWLLTENTFASRYSIIKSFECYTQLIRKVEMRMERNPCLTCGACCAFLHVVFPSCEISSQKANSVPIHLTHRYDLSQSAMNGTELRSPRCNALIGRVGFKVSCSIYHNRPSTCRIFKRSWERNEGNCQCDRARKSYGLQPFSQYWIRMLNKNGFENCYLYLRQLEVIKKWALCLLSVA